MRATFLVCTSSTSAPIIQVVFTSTGRQHTVLDHVLVSRHSGQKQRQANLHTISLPCYATIGPCRSMQKGAKRWEWWVMGIFLNPRLATPPFCTHLSKRNRLLLDKCSHHSSCLHKHRQATHCFGPCIGESPQWSKTEAGQPSYRTRPPTIHTACALEERR